MNYTSDINYYSAYGICMGFVVGFIWYALLLGWTYHLYQKHNCNFHYLWKITLSFAFLQILASIFYWAFPYNPDSFLYFYHANPAFGFNTQFCTFITYYLKSYVFGNSIFAAFIFAGGLSFMGAIYTFLTFKVIAEEKGWDFKKVLDVKFLIFPIAIIMLWPSKIYYGCGIAKDSITFFLVPLFFYYTTLFFLRKNLKYGLLAFLSFGLVFLVRPYLFMILFGAAIFNLVFSKKIGWTTRVGTLFVLCISMFFLIDFLQKSAGFQLNLSAITNRSVLEQTAENSGSSFPVPTSNPAYILFFLPYTMAANAFLPLFYPAKNILGILASFENIFLVYLFVFWLKNKKYVFGKIKDLLSLLNWFFFFGILYLGMVNTNVGLALRQKLIYLPLFLISVGITYLAKKQHLASKDPNHRE